MKKFMVISLIAVLSLTSIGCNKDNFKQALVEIPLGVYSHDFNEVSGFFDVYEAWKYDVDNLYVQADIDNYTNTYLLEEMPRLFSTLINAANKYDMKVYALLNNKSWLSEDDIVFQEIDNVLLYNKKHKERRFKGISIDVNLDNLNEGQLECYYNNLERVRKMIDNHNEKRKDNLILTVKVNKDMDKFINLADKIILDYNDKEALNNLNEVEVIIEIEEIVANKDTLRKLSNIINEYDNFDGLIIKDYKSYLNSVKALDL